MVICVGHITAGHWNRCSIPVSVVTYLVYPGARSCIRFERLIEGIQAHEKINILRQEFEKKGNKAGLKKIEKMLAPFNLGSMPEIPAAITVNRANQILNSF